MSGSAPGVTAGLAGADGVPRGAADSARAPRTVAGSDRISSAALVRTAQAVAADALRIPFRDTRARVSDDGSGALAVEITGPLAVPVLGSGNVPALPVVQTAHGARGVIAERVRTITGRQVARVSIVYDSSIVEQPRRVR